MVRKQVQRNKPSHNPPHRYTSQQYYPNINKGMATPCSSLEDMAEQEDEAEEPKVDKDDVEAVGEQSKFQPACTLCPGMPTTTYNVLQQNELLLQPKCMLLVWI